MSGDKVNHGHAPRLGADRSGHSGNEPMLPADAVARQAVDLLTDPDRPDEDRYAAANALWRIGESGIPAVLDLLHHDDGRVRAAAARALAHLLDRSETRRFVRAARWTSYALREEGPAAYARLHDAVLNGSRASRVVGAVALGQLGDQRAVPDLIESMNDSYRLARLAAIHALGLLGNSAAVPYLADALEDPSDVIQEAARLALHRIQQPDEGQKESAS